MHPILISFILSMVVSVPVAHRVSASDEQGESQSNSSSAFVERADRLLADAGDSIGAARAWLEKNVSKGTLDAAARHGRRVMDARIERMLREAREHRERTMGTFTFEPNPSGTGQGTWKRFDGISSSASAVVLVHGLDEPGDIWRELAPRLEGAGHNVVRFDYANDQGIARSADEFEAALVSLHGAGVERVTLVCHSMGGLLARDVLTRDTQGDLPEFERLITVGTPNKGSAFASLRSLGEIREQFARWIESGGRDSRALLGFVGDGDGEAGEDLLPSSEYLAELNARGLPADIEITVIAGKIKDVQGEDLDRLLDSSFVQRTLGPERSRRLRREALRAADGLGDGVVTVDSAMIEGVQDSVVVEADHRSMLRTVKLERVARRMLGDARDEPPAITIIMDRLGDADP